VQSVVIDEESAKKLKVVVTEADVIVNIPFIVISVGILLGVIFIVLMCRQQLPQVMSLLVFSSLLKFNK